MKTSVNITLWIAAFILALAIARYQRLSGPTYPVDGTVELGETGYEYSIKRTHGGISDHPVQLIISELDVTGSVIWKRYKLEEPLREIQMTKYGDTLKAYLPHQPPAGKLEYQVILKRGEELKKLPPEEPAVIRFKGAVPISVLIVHIALMFGALILAARTGFAALLRKKTSTLAWVTLVLMSVGGLVFGPIVQKYAFGAYWTGWPLGEDLTDNKTAVMALIWVITVWRLSGKKQYEKYRWWVLAAVICTFLVYLIPHSMRGSELDYSTLSPDSLKTLSTHDPNRPVSGGFDHSNP